MEGGDNGLNHIAVCAIAAANMDLGLLVHWLALFGEAGEGGGAIPLPKQGTRVAPSRSLGKDVDRRIQPDRDRPFIKQFASSWIDERTASCSDDPDRAVDQSGDQSAFAITKVAFAVTFEQFGR